MDAHQEGQICFATRKSLAGIFFLYLTERAGFHSHSSNSQPPGVFLTSVACQASSKYEGGRNLTPDPDLVISLVQGPREITDA